MRSISVPGFSRVRSPNRHLFYLRGHVHIYDSDIHQRVAVYVRVSTGSVGQTTSFELQKKYYEDFVIRHPHWELVQIYADHGVSGTSLKHRDAFDRMIADCKTGRIDLILTKSVSRFSRNVVICMEIVRKLAELIPPVGVFFESEHIFSMDADGGGGVPDAKPQHGGVPANAAYALRLLKEVERDPAASANHRHLGQRLATRPYRQVKFVLIPLSYRRSLLNVFSEF